MGRNNKCFVPGCKSGYSKQAKCALFGTPKVITVKQNLMVCLKCKIYDYTLWPFWVDTHVTPPFRKISGNVVVDATGSRVRFYSEVPQILNDLYSKGFQLAVVSRTSEIQGAYQLLDLFGWSKFFNYKEVYPGTKVKHFNELKKQSGIQFEDMLFFDDEQRNINDLRNVGVVSILVNNGLNKKVVEEGFEAYSNQHNKPKT